MENVNALMASLETQAATEAEAEKQRQKPLLPLRSSR
jgi:hypothetical protein